MSEGKHTTFTTGVYKIVNWLDGKVYIGSAGKSLRTRLKQHRNALRANRHQNRHLQNAWNRDGEESFVFSVIERCEPGKCIEREQAWIDDCLASGVELYNHYLNAASPLGSKHTEETKAHLSEVRKRLWQDPEFKAKMASRDLEPWSEESRQSFREKMCGRKHSEEEKAKRVASMRRFYQTEEGKAERKRKGQELAAIWTGRKHTAESRRKMSEAAKGKRSDEHRKAISDTHKKLWADPEYRAMMIAKKFGKKNAAGKRTAEQRARMSAAQKARYRKAQVNAGSS